MELAMKGWDEQRKMQLDPGAGELVVDVVPSRFRIDAAHRQAIEELVIGTAVHVMAETLPRAEAEAPDRSDKPWWRL